jgi:excisionase family DNA binding protein
MEKLAAKSIYTTHDLSRLLHVNPRSVINWIEQELLQSFRTPGGHRRVRHDDLMAFLHKHNMPIPESLIGGVFNILIVDGQKDGAIQRSIDGRPGHNVTTTSDGIQALLAVGHERPDLLILDLQISGVEALEVCRRIKTDPHCRTAIIAVGNSSQESAAALEAGADAFMTRPVEAEPLIAQMRKLLRVM